MIIVYVIRLSMISIFRKLSNQFEFKRKFLVTEFIVLMRYILKQYNELDCLV